MGHIRLGRIPKVKPWKQVFDVLESSAPSAGAIARAVAEATQERFESAKGDWAINYCFWVLIRTLTASRNEDFTGELDRAGLHKLNLESRLAFVGSLTRSVEREVRLHATDYLFGQIAQASLREVLTESVMTATESLFETGPSELHSIVKQHSTDHQMGLIARQYFAKIASRTVRFVADKEAANSLGQGGLRTSQDISSLWRDVDRYCYDVSRIVQDFAVGWISKANFETEYTISLDKAVGFTSYAIEKMIMDLREVKA